MKIKYPRTHHLPFSPGTSSDDKVIATLAAFEGEEVVITEKMDGENTSMYRDMIHARSLDSKYHISREWVKSFHASIAYNIPDGCRICGESLYARHSVAYQDLESYFLGFGVWRGDKCLDWDTTQSIFTNLGIKKVREFGRGVFNLKTLLNLAVSMDINKTEGFVVRVTREFNMDEFSSVVAKWVRPGHVTSDDHWMNSTIVPNRMAS